jgi:protoporphyrinogen oxidase
VAAKACPELSDDERRRHLAIRYQGIVCASLLLKRPLAGFYVTNITDPVPFTAVIEMSALVDRREFGGNHLVYLPKYIDANDPYFHTSDKVVREEFLAGLRKMYPDLRSDEVLEFKVSRVRHVLAIATLNYSSSLPPMATAVPGLFIVNSAHIVNGTLNVNETIQLAERATPLLLSHTAPRPQPVAV